MAQNNNPSGQNSPFTSQSISRTPVNNLIPLNINRNKVPEINQGLWLGFNAGMFFANRYNAGFYNGNSNNVNNIEYILNNQYHYNDIKHVLNNYDFHLGEVPEKMKYDPAYTIGFVIKYNHKNDLGFFIQFNYVKLHASDIFTLHTDSLTFTSESAYRFGEIYGNEERSNIDFGICKTYYAGEKTLIFVEGGFNFNSTNVIDSKIRIEDLEYSIINIYLNQAYVPNTSLTEYNVKQGGIGYGFFAGAGLQLIFNESISLDPGASLYFTKINLEGYTAFKPSYMLYVRFTFRNIL